MGLLTNAPTAHGGPVQNQRNQWIDAQMSMPAIASTGVGQFIVTANATSKGIDVTFKLTDVTGIKLVTLVRSVVMDMKQATVLQTWAPKVATYTWSDTDAVLQQSGAAYYWVLLAPLNTNGTELQAGPQFILLNPSLLPPLALDGVSASHAAVSNGTVLVTCNVSAIPAGESVKMFVSGYEGNASFVAVAQHSSAPMQFALKQTGETITIKAIATSSGGTEAASGPTCTLVLGTAATAVAQVQGVLITQIATGNQASWPSSIETGVTAYQLYRALRNSGFGSATLLATIAATSVGTVLYLDTAGLTGDWEYYVITVAGSGNSPASIAANPQVLYSSSQVPGNATSNTSNTAYLDSVDAGSSATMRVYGAGGPGTSYTRKAGYGTITRLAGSVAGLAYSTRYYVIYDTVGLAYLASTTYTDSLPDGYEWVGTLVTVASGGGGGGGGGGTGATGTANITGSPVGGIGGVNVTNNGYGYGTASVSFTGAGVGATGNVTCSGGQVLYVTMTNQGGGYTTSTTVTFTSTSPYYGGGGNTNGGQRYVVTS